MLLLSLFFTRAAKQTAQLWESDKMKTFIKHNGTSDCRVTFQLSQERFELVRNYFRKAGQRKTAQVRFTNGAAIYAQGGGWYAIYGDGHRVDAALEGLHHVRTALARKVRPAPKSAEVVVRKNVFNPAVKRIRIKVVYTLNRGFKVPVLKDYAAMARDFYETSLRRQRELSQRQAATKAELAASLSKLAARFGKNLHV